MNKHCRIVLYFLLHVNKIIKMLKIKLMLTYSSIIFLCRRRLYQTSNGNDTFSSDEMKTKLDQQSYGNV